jgi:hypothetical protein
MGYDEATVGFILLTDGVGFRHSMESVTQIGDTPIPLISEETWVRGNGQHKKYEMVHGPCAHVGLQERLCIQCKS